MKDNNNEEKILEHKLSILDLCFHKKMYQPTEIIVDINITPAEGKSTEYRTLLSPTTSRSYLSL